MTRNRGLKVSRSRWERFKTWLRRHPNEVPWICVGLLFFVALGLGYWGYHSSGGRETRSINDNIYSALQLFGLEFGSVEPPIALQLHIARVLAPLVTATTLIITAFAIARRHLTEIKTRGLEQHVVICGLGPSGQMFAESFRADGHTVVAIETDESAVVDRCREAGIDVLIGDASDEAMLEKAGVPGARYAIAACGDDGINAEVATHVRSLLGVVDRETPLDCFVHIDDTDLYSRLSDAPPSDSSDEGQSGEGARMQFFNPSETAAPVMLLRDPALALDRDARSAPPKILVVGLGQMGSRLVLHAARCWRHLRADPTQMLPITIVDSSADDRTAALKWRYEWLKDVCELDALEMSIESADFQAATFREDGGEKQFLDGVTSVYVCLDSDDRGLKAAFTLHRHLSGTAVPIVVRTARLAGLATLIPSAGEAGVANQPMAFGLLCRGCTVPGLLSPRNEILAQVIHEDQRRRPRTPQQKLADKAALREWGALDEDHRNKNRARAEEMGKMLEELECFIIPLPDTDAPIVKLDLDSDELAELVKREQGPSSTGQEPNGWTWDEERLRGIPGFLVRAELLVVRGDRWEVVARAMHEKYVRDQLNAGHPLGSKPALREWDALDEHYRESNRAAARDIAAKLEAVGCEMVSVTARVPGLVTFSPDEVERLAEMEHDRWAEEKEADGFTWGPHRDDAAKKHPDLKPWRELSSRTKEIDRQSVRGIPLFLSRVGFAVARKDR